jgi:hypothetical protein
MDAAVGMLGHDHTVCLHYPAFAVLALWPVPPYALRARKWHHSNELLGQYTTIKCCEPGTSSDEGLAMRLFRGQQRIFSCMVHDHMQSGSYATEHIMASISVRWHIRL